MSENILYVVEIAVISHAVFFNQITSDHTYIDGLLHRLIAYPPDSQQAVNIVSEN